MRGGSDGYYSTTEGGEVERVMLLMKETTTTTSPGELGGRRVHAMERGRRSESLL